MSKFQVFNHSGRWGVMFPRNLALCVLVVFGVIIGYKVFTSNQYVITLPADCPPADIRLSRTPFPVTALVSYPGSGNTWLRHLVQQATGLGTGSVYCDSELAQGEFPWECVRNGSVILIKQHHRNVYWRLTDVTQIVLLIRSPFAAFRAEFNRLYTNNNHTGFAPLETSKGHWSKFVRRFAPKWTEAVLTWIHFTGPKHVIKYEDLKTDLGYELQTLLDFLRVPTSQRRISCAIVNSEGKFHRKTVESSLNFDKRLRALVQRQIDIVYRKTNLAF